MKKMLSRLVVAVSILCFISGLSLVHEAEAETPIDESVSSDKVSAVKDVGTIAGKEKKHYTFRLGKVRMKDTHNYPSINKDIKDVLLIRFLLPSRDVDEEYPFYLFDKDWFKNHFDLHVGVATQGEPNIYMVGANFEINKFVDIIGGISLSNDIGYKHHMYYYGITFDSQLFQNIIDMIQDSIKMAEK